MLVETDIMLAFVKESDWLKPHAEALMEAAEKGILELHVSREVIHELYYVAKRLGIPLDMLLERITYLANLPGLRWIPTDVEVDLAALALMVEYDLTSIFDAYHAATALLRDPHSTIISTDHKYDAIPGLARVDPKAYEPRELVAVLSTRLG